MSESKLTYYVSVQDGSILHSQDAAPYELVIEASEQEVKKLREMFEERLSAEYVTFKRAATPFVQYHNDRSNDIHDYILMEIYQMIYNLGTPPTREHILSMGILDNPTITSDLE